MVLVVHRKVEMVVLELQYSTEAPEQTGVMVLVLDLHRVLVKDILLETLESLMASVTLVVGRVIEHQVKVAYQTIQKEQVAPHIHLKVTRKMQAYLLLVAEDTVAAVLVRLIQAM